MSNKIVAVTFVSENMCEFMVNGGEFTHFAVRGLGRGVRQIGDGKMETISTCSGVTAEIPRSSNTILGAPYGEYGTMFNLLDQDHCVTQVILTYEDETEETVWVPYMDDADYTNLCMQTRITEDGTLQMVIDDKYTLEDVFACECGSCEGCCTAGAPLEAEEQYIVFDCGACGEHCEKD